MQDSSSVLNGTHCYIQDDDFVHVKGSLIFHFFMVYTRMLAAQSLFSLFMKFTYYKCAHSPIRIDLQSQRRCLKIFMLNASILRMWTNHLVWLLCFMRYVLD